MKLHRVKLRHLECFLEVVRLESLTRAATALAVGQPTISKALKELEESVGSRLLERDRSGIRLTPAGDEFYRFAASSISTLRAGLEQLGRGGNKGAGVIRIGCPFNVASQFLPEAIAAFRAQPSDARFVVRSGATERLIATLRDGDIAMLVSRLPEPAQLAGLRFEPLYDEIQMFVVGPRHPLAGVEAFEVERLLAYPFVMHSTLTSVQHDIDQFLMGLGLTKVEPVLVANGPDLARGFLQLSDAIWCVPAGQVAADLAEGRLCRLAINTSSLRRTIGVTTRPDLPPVGLSNAFLATLREIAKRFTLV